MVIEEEWFDDTNLTNGTTFPTPLIKCAKTRANQKINFLRDTKQYTCKISIKNGWNTHITHILHDISDVNFFSKEIC